MLIVFLDKTQFDIAPWHDIPLLACWMTSTVTWWFIGETCRWFVVDSDLLENLGEHWRAGSYNSKKNIHIRNTNTNLLMLLTFKNGEKYFGAIWITRILLGIFSSNALRMKKSWIIVSWWNSSLHLKSARNHQIHSIPLVLQLQGVRWLSG